jgi:dihydroxyacetone kinase-like protein
MPINTHDLQRMFSLIADEIAKKRDWLCELDGVIGDGDHGLAMEGGWHAAATALALLDGDHTPPTAAFNAAAKAFLNAIGASSGPLYATAFMRAGAAVKGKEELSDDDFLAAFCALSQGIQDRGKAEIGEKTMVDAWKPAAEAALQARANGEALASCLDAAVRAARDGCEATKGMVATKGRSSRLGDRSLGHVDPGAASAVIVIEAISSFAGS